MLASAALLPKFVWEGAAMYHELRKQGTSAFSAWVDAENFVMAGRAAKAARVVPAIHVFRTAQCKTWMPGTRPGMTIQPKRQML